MAEGVLQIAEVAAVVEVDGGEAVPQRVRRKLPPGGELSGAGEAADEPEQGRLVEACAAGGDEQRPGELVDAIPTVAARCAR